jgi:hypothetical protein
VDGVLHSSVGIIAKMRKFFQLPASEGASFLPKPLWPFRLKYSKVKPLSSVSYFSVKNKKKYSTGCAKTRRSAQARLPHPYPQTVDI